MKLNHDTREQMFNQGKEIHHTLGGLFQNEMDITPDLVDIELHQLEKLKLDIELFKSNLLMLKRKVS